MHAGNRDDDKGLQVQGLIEHLTTQQRLLKSTLPFLAGLARRLDLLFPEVHIGKSTVSDYGRLFFQSIVYSD